MVTETIIEKSKMALPYLVYNAQKRKTLTYLELGTKIDAHPHAVVPRVLGYLRDEICAKRGFPLINVIVVNKKTQMPGDSFLPGAEHLSKEEKKVKFEEIRDEIFAFDKWDDLLKDLGLSPIKKKPEDFKEEARAYMELLKKRKNVGEGLAHLKLKNYVAENPECIGVPSRTKWEVEFPFISGDECDVVFDISGDKAVVVEIKNGERGELIKGIYQAIKYRALMVAEKGKGKDYDVAAFLVAYNIPDDIIDYARIFDINCKIITYEMID